MEPLTTLRMIRPLDDIATTNAIMDPSIRLQDIRKRMRVGRHKYAVPGWNAEEHVSSSQEDSIFAQPLLPLASPGQDDAAELVNLLRIRDVCANVEGTTTSTQTPSVQPPMSTLSPPPTPGRDHDNVSFPTDFPKLLPLGSSRQVSNDCTAANESEAITLTLTLDEKAKHSPLPSIRLKPTFTSPLLQELISSHQSKTKGPNNDGSSNGSSSVNKVPELPFQSDAGAATATNGVPSSMPNDIKAPAKVAMARLPHRIQEITERATAA